MPKKVTEAELQTAVDAVMRHPEGASIAQLGAEIGGAISRSTLARRLASLVRQGRIRRRGAGRATTYWPAASAAMTAPAAIGQFETPDGTATIPLSGDARDQLEYVSRPLASRRPCGYERRLLDEYVPNRTAWLPDRIKVHLHRIGRPIVAERAAGTFTRDILGRFLIDLSWASSRLEGNTYTRLDTERLIQFGEHAAGKDARETQMILNHKAAIEFVVEGDREQVGINRFTVLNLHSLLSENLMADPEASGRLRKRPVDIIGSVYTPSGVPQLIEEEFERVLLSAGAIGDPFERAFYLMVALPYLQPFEDVNKRVARLAANLPLVRGDLCPLSFVDVPERAYVAGYLALYELTRIDLLRDIFVWAYQRSCQRYVVIRDSVAEPDLFRLRYRTALAEVIGGIVRRGGNPSPDAIREQARSLVEPEDLPRFVAVAQEDFRRLNEGNIARYRIGLPQYRQWRAANA
jgi:hypothetical protein